MEFEDFVEEYSMAYLLPEDRKVKNKINGICYQQTCESVEKEILAGDITCYQDFAKFMAWKIGRIRHIASQHDGGIRYYKGWEECTCRNPRTYVENLNLIEFHKRLDLPKIKALATDGKWKAAIGEIDKAKVSGIGIVYEIAILFFASRGLYPIYDRFVYTALECLFTKKQRTPRRGDSKDYLNIDVLGKYEEYIERMECLAKIVNCTNYIEYRELDRALWVYGHGFKAELTSIV